MCVCNVTAAGVRVIITAWLVWNFCSQTGMAQELATPEHPQAVLSVAFSPDSTLIATGSQDNLVRVWKTEAPKDVTTLAGHGNSVTSVAFTPDGQTLASGSMDGQIKLWDVGTKKELVALKAKEGRVRSVAISADGKLLVSGNDDGNVILWDLVTRKELLVLSAHKPGAGSVAISPDGKTIASAPYAYGQRDTIKLWDVASGKLRATLKGHTGSVGQVKFSPDGKILGSAGAGYAPTPPDPGEVILWDVASGMTLATLPGSAFGLSFTPEGKYLAAEDGNAVTLWELTTKRALPGTTGNGTASEWIWCIAVSPDGKLLATGGGMNSPGRLKLWDFTRILENRLK